MIMIRMQFFDLLLWKDNAVIVVKTGKTKKRLQNNKQTSNKQGKGKALSLKFLWPQNTKCDIMTTLGNSWKRLNKINSNEDSNEAMKMRPRCKRRSEKRQKSKRKSIPSLDVADRILMDLLEEQKQRRRHTSCNGITENTEVQSEEQFETKGHSAMGDNKNNNDNNNSNQQTVDFFVDSQTNNDPPIYSYKKLPKSQSDVVSIPFIIEPHKMNNDRLEEEEEEKDKVDWDTNTDEGNEMTPSDSESQLNFEKRVPAMDDHLPLHSDNVQGTLMACRKPPPASGFAYGNWNDDTSSPYTKTSWA
ncbi:hypothetical protein RFI_17030, partial [Reticulomyxa filosa]